MSSHSNQTVETKERDLIISRTFNAPRELVFETYTTCEHLKNWWGPRSWPMEECEIDFKEGGKWHFCLRGPNEGDESWALAEYKEIVPPEKIVYIDNFSDEKGTINPEMPSLLNTVKFNSMGDKTEVVTQTRMDSKEELDKLIEMGVIEGFTESLDRLDEHLEAVQK